MRVLSSLAKPDTNNSTEAHGPVVIELKDVSKLLQGKLTLNRINFAVRAREFVTILGPSGCGKSTLLSLISGLDQPNQGTIVMDGQCITQLPPQARKINTIFQNYALFPHLTVFENIAFGLRCQSLPQSVIESRTRETLAQMEIESLASRWPEQLSGGQQQRVAIARAIVNRPRVLLLDESLSALDHRLRQTMRLRLKQLQRELQIAFILVTHDQEEALSIADRVIVMDEGGILQIGTPREVYEEPCNLQVARFIGEVNIFETNVIQQQGKRLECLIDGRRLHFNSQKKFLPDTAICVLVRPEDLQIWKEKPPTAPNVFEGQVEQVIYKGSTVDLIVQLKSNHRFAATQFFNEDDETLDYRLGESVWVSWVLGWEVILANDA